MSRKWKSFLNYANLLHPAPSLYKKPKRQDPRNPIVKWLMWRNALRLAKELEKEFKK